MVLKKTVLRPQWSSIVSPFVHMGCLSGEVVNRLFAVQESPREAAARGYNKDVIYSNPPAQ